MARLLAHEVFIEGYISSLIETERDRSFNCLIVHNMDRKGGRVVRRRTRIGRIVALNANAGKMWGGII